jgi:hypothetical protein
VRPVHTRRLTPDGRVLPCPRDPHSLSRTLAASAGLPEIDLHDVRHSYATAGRDAKIDWKALSQRIGHADVAPDHQRGGQLMVAPDTLVSPLSAAESRSLPPVAWHAIGFADPEQTSNPVPSRSALS